MVSGRLIFKMDIANRIYNQCRNDGIPDLLSQFITAQSAHETGGWTSDIFIDCNNGFGYKWIGQSTALGPCSLHPAYAAYSSIEQSTTELTKWIYRRQREGSFPHNLNSIVTYSQYATLLKNAGYFEDTLSHYIDGLSYWLQRLNFKQVAAGGGGLLLVGGLLVWIYRKRLFHSKH